MTEKNKTPCPCCGQQRTYPLEPGKWKYRAGLDYFDWRIVTVKREIYDGEEVLTMTHESETEPDWWPENVKWEKVE